ncbi:endolytic transglycosylase MltG [Motiliproteus sp. MSK22-1]|uniref:endolytic transglycosylase MltG n=1 Tax=Motiliproteus sp. MSK22-1 TaxID=1897630 RepID=UPI0009788FF8|nr:endolytic transglycosylase MltG [Motiliproteus sp. MSK22-1]OMH32659.1 hypothetical protein BGP75_14030 [Motiliproteus sp. MSK22-1]
MIRKLFLLTVVVVMGVAIAGVFGKQHIESFGDTPISLTEDTLYELRPGTSVRGMVSELEKLGVIDDGLKLRLFSRMQKELQQIKTGEYQLKPQMSHRELLQLFVDGKVVQRQITFVEGLRSRDYLARLAADPIIIKTLEGKSTEDIALELGITPAHLEGWIYPDTYSYTKNTRDIDILNRAHNTMKHVLQEEWANRQENLPLKTPYEALILASIVEKETAAPEERAQIAGVFIRRLKKKMRLQTDPTVIYGMGDAYKGNIRRSDLNKYTAYNTYKIKGLTPTPIANPGREAIHAVLNPAPGKALYFVAKGDGRHQFSSTLAEHNRAVNNFQKNQRRKNYRSVPKSASSSNTDLPASVEKRDS